MFHLEAEKELLERICPFENAENINMCQRAYCPFFHEHPHDWLPKEAEETDDEEGEEEMVEVMALKPSAGPAQSADTSGMEVGDKKTAAAAAKKQKPDSPELIDLTQDSDSAEARGSSSSKSGSDVSGSEKESRMRRRGGKKISDAILPSAVRNKSKKKRFIVSDSDDDGEVKTGLKPPGNDKGRKTSGGEKTSPPAPTTATASSSGGGGAISHNATMIAKRHRKRQRDPPEIDSRQLVRRYTCTRPRKVLSSNFNCVVRLDDTDFASALKRVGDKRGTVDLSKHPFVARLQEPPPNAFKPNKHHRSINRQVIGSSDDSAPPTSGRFDPVRRKKSSERPPTRVKGPNSSRSAPSAIHQKRSNEHLEARSPEGSERKKIKKKKINNHVNSSPAVSAHVTAEEIARLNEDLFDERSVLNEEEEKRLKNKLRRQERKRKEQALKRQRNGSTSSSGSVGADGGASGSTRPERSDINPVVITKKTRIAHKPQNSNALPPRPNKNGVPPRKKIKSPYEVMQERNLMRQNNEMAKFLANKHKEQQSKQQHRGGDINATKTFTEEQKKLLLQRTTSLDSSSSSSPIARLSSKQAPSNNATSLNTPLIKVQSKSQPRQRQAHQSSNFDQLTKPLVTTRDRVAGVNRTFRQAYVDLIVKKMKKKKTGSSEAFKFAIEEEERLNQSSRNKLDYRHRMMRLITRVDKAPASPPPSYNNNSSSSPTSSSSTSSSNVQVSFKKGQRIAHNADARQAAAVRNRSKSASTLHSSTTNNNSSSRQHAHLNNNNRNWRDNHQNRQSEKDFYEKLLPYIMTEEQLLENKFPRPTSIKGVCRFKDATAGTYKSNNTRRTCKRCLKEFTVNEYNNEMDMECNYHPGKLYYTKVGASGEKRYSCCNEPPGATACDTADSHVHEENKADNRGYASTAGGVSRSSSCPGLYAVDCEMVYTVVGFELVRVSVISHEFKTVYDKMVMPKGRVLDYNTKFSGVNEKDLIGVTRSLEDVQRDLLTFISPKTILLGHSLESDLVALKMIHSYVVDTSIVFPHNKGPPLKRALRNLMSEHLGIIIQSADSTGHDSTEDASSCIKLMAWRIKQDRRN